MEINPKIKKLELEKNKAEHELEIIKSKKIILQHELEISKIQCEIIKIDKEDVIKNFINDNQEENTIELVNKYQLEEFVKEKFCTYSFDRMLRYNNKCGFRKYDSFLKKNNKQINANSNEDTEFILSLANKINRNYIEMADYDHCTMWEATAFYYNKKGELCIMHPR
jgi:hypothetical protein